MRIIRACELPKKKDNPAEVVLVKILGIRKDMIQVVRESNDSTQWPSQVAVWVDKINKVGIEACLKELRHNASRKRLQARDKEISEETKFKEGDKEGDKEPKQSKA